MSQQIVNELLLNATSRTILGAWRTALAMATVHLYKTGSGINQGSSEADLAAAEADFDGYAAAVVAAWSVVSLDQDGGYVFFATVAFNCTGNTAPNTIAGAWVETAANVVYGVFPLAVPVTMNANLQYINLAIYFRSPQPSTAVFDN